jgi:hypothetical protein
MAVCASCGNDYDKAFEIRLASGETHFFDSFECAIHMVALSCQHCGCKIVGHGHESGGLFYCCVFCASQSGVKGLRDRVDAGHKPG